MLASEISKLIEEEIDGNWDILNPHGVDLGRCLVPPTKKAYKSATDGVIEELWLVLEEYPENQSGYKIVFDEKSEEFGLATGDFFGGPDVFLGIYGTFLETLSAM